MNRVRHTALIGIALITALFAVALGKRIHLESSDSFRTYLVGNENILDFTGNVHFSKDSSQLYCDRAVWYEKRDLVRLLGRVKIVQPGRVLAADSVRYDQASEIAHAFGNVVLEDSLRHVRFTGGRAILHEPTRLLKMYEQPRLFLDFDLPTTATAIFADTIQYDSQNDLVLADNNVIIDQRAFKAESDSGSIEVRTETMTLIGSVTAEQRQNELAGDTMIVRSHQKKIQDISVAGNGEAVFRRLAQAESDSLIFNESRLTADRIDFFFQNDLLDIIKAQGNSYTYYRTAPEDTTSRGNNTASGDSTILRFQNSQLTDVYIITSAEGTYTTTTELDSLGNVAAADTVNYQANRIHFDLFNDWIYLEQSARVHQQQIELEANKIDYNLGRKIVYAHAKTDTTGGFEPLTLKEGSEVITGEELVYDIESKRGKLKDTRTKLEQAYYSSQTLRKEDEGELLVEDGVYTTCELDEPHFHFSSSNMKLITGDKVFARPVVLYIETVPVFALPYFVFSIKKDRHSGFLPIQFGNFERGSRFVNNLGYFWAMSEYWDLTTWLDISESVGITFNAGARYAVRYKLNGSINGSFSRETTYSDVERGRRNRGQLTFSHNQQLTPSVTIAGSGTFVSDRTYFTETSTDLDERLKRQLSSNLSISKRWQSASITAALDQTRDLDTDSHSERLPTIRFSMPSRSIFGEPKSGDPRHWYHDIYFSYSNRFENFQQKFLLNGTPQRKKYAALGQDASTRLPFKLAGALTVTPSLSFADNWYYLPNSDQADSTGLETESIKSRQTWSASTQFSTNLYGMVEPNLGGITAVRHVFSPSATFNYRPKIEKNQDYASFTGFGGSSFESKNVSFSFRNQFQIKYRSGEAEKKLNLFNLDFGVSHNFLADERRWSNLTTSLRIPSIPKVTLQVNATHDLYNPVTEKLQWWNPYLKSLSVNTGYSGVLPFTVGRTSAAQGPQQEPTDQYGFPLTGGQGGAGGQNSFRYSVSHRYTENRSTTFTSISHWIDFSCQFNVTRNWRVSYSQNYNIRDGESTEQLVELYRDLHCWEARFTWIPQGSRAGYYFKLNVKLLPELKFEKSESGIRDALLGGLDTFR